MKYSTQIIIDLPREEVFNKMENRTDLQHWQRDLISQKLLSGRPGEEGARSKMKFKIGKREIDVIETITSKNTPKKIHTTYEAPGVHSTIKNFFEPEPGNRTLWTSESEFRFSGVWRILNSFRPGGFKKQTRQFMQDFKAFAEEGKSVRESQPHE